MQQLPLKESGQLWPFELQLALQQLTVSGTKLKPQSSSHLQTTALLMTQNSTLNARNEEKF